MNDPQPKQAPIRELIADLDKAKIRRIALDYDSATDTLLVMRDALRLALDAIDETIDCCEAFKHDHCYCLPLVEARHQIQLLTPHP